MKRIVFQMTVLERDGDGRDKGKSVSFTLRAPEAMMRVSPMDLGALRSAVMAHMDGFAAPPFGQLVSRRSMAQREYEKKALDTATDTV